MPFLLQVEPILALRGVVLQIAQQPDLLAANLRSVAAFARESRRSGPLPPGVHSGAADARVSRVRMMQAQRGGERAAAGRGQRGHRGGEEAQPPPRGLIFCSLSAPCCRRR